MTLRLQPFLAFQNGQGSFSDNHCHLDTIGAISEIPGGTLEGEARRPPAALHVHRGHLETYRGGHLDDSRRHVHDHRRGHSGHRGDERAPRRGWVLLRAYLEEGGPGPDDPNSFPLPPDAGMWLDAFVAPGVDVLPPQLVPKVYRPECPPVP